MDWYAKSKDAPPAEQQHYLQQGLGALRSTYESFVIDTIFNGVVRRWEERIGFDRLTGVIVNRELLEEVVARMGDLSRHIEAHLHSDEFASEKPTPQMLLDAINRFTTLRNQHKDGKKPSPPIAVKPAAAPATLAQKEDSPKPAQPKVTPTVN